MRSGVSEDASERFGVARKPGPRRLGGGTGRGGGLARGACGGGGSAGAQAQFEEAAGRLVAHPRVPAGRRGGFAGRGGALQVAAAGCPNHDQGGKARCRHLNPSLCPSPRAQASTAAGIRVAGFQHPSESSGRGSALQVPGSGERHRQSHASSESVGIAGRALAVPAAAFKLARRLARPADSDGPNGPGGPEGPAWPGWPAPTGAARLSDCCAEANPATWVVGSAFARRSRSMRRCLPSAAGRPAPPEEARASCSGDSSDRRVGSRSVGEPRLRAGLLTEDRRMQQRLAAWTSESRHRFDHARARGNGIAPAAGLSATHRGEAFVQGPAGSNGEEKATVR